MWFRYLDSEIWLSFIYCSSIILHIVVIVNVGPVLYYYFFCQLCWLMLFPVDLGVNQWPIFTPANADWLFNMKRVFILVALIVVSVVCSKIFTLWSVFSSITLQFLWSLLIQDSLFWEDRTGLHWTDLLVVTHAFLCHPADLFIRTEIWIERLG